MFVSRRDYVLRMIEEITQLLARIVFQRERNQPREALQSIVQGCERLFAMEADQLFQFTPKQHFTMLTEGLSMEDGRAKVLLYAALNEEAARIYENLGNAAMSRASFANALRFVLTAERRFSHEHWPAFAPKAEDLIAKLKDSAMDADLEELLRTRVPFE